MRLKSHNIGFMFVELKNVITRAIWKAGTMCFPLNCLVSFIMGVNTAVGQCSCCLEVPLASLFSPFSDIATCLRQAQILL